MSELKIIGIGFLIFLLYEVYKYWQANTLKRFVAWSVSDDSRKYRAGLYLHEYIYNAQNHLNLPKEYRISGDDELNFVKEILDEYKKDLTQSYFYSHLGLSWRMITKASGEEYFMSHLYYFLGEHQCDHNFCGHDMQGFSIDCNDNSYSHTYPLTDFAILYYKMYYISLFFCKNSKILNPKGKCYLHDDDVRENLDTRTITLIRYS